jgi:hypothetical protein
LSFFDQCIGYIHYTLNIETKLFHN